MSRRKVCLKCPGCGEDAVRILQTKRRQWCVVRYAVCGWCGRRFRLVSSGGWGGEAPKKADR